MRRKFFLSKFIMFLSLSLIPVCIFGVLSVFYINRQVKEDALEKSVSVTDVMELTIEELTSTLEIFKTTVNSDARFHLAVLSMLGNDSPENVDPSHFSQTMQSLAATNDVCTLPVYRPLIGFDKQEIVDVAERIDTYETSIQPFEDCCTIFVAKHPVTKPSIEVIRRSEERLSEKIDSLFAEAVRTAEVIEIK